MELHELLADIHELRTHHVERLAESAYNLFKTTNNPHVESVADYLHYELTTIASKLQDLEDTQEHEDYDVIETYETEDASEICDWWTGLDLVSKTELANVPMPTTDYGRGDEYFECEERCNKWWYSRTYEQKKEIYDENCETY